jgi:hypothetical protein
MKNFVSLILFIPYLLLCQEYHHLKYLEDLFFFLFQFQSLLNHQIQEKILLDFYLINNTLSKEGNRVKATINDEEFFIYEWSPYIINGLPKGETTIKLELLDNQNKLIENPFNPTTRTIILD